MINFHQKFEEQSKNFFKKLPYILKKTFENFVN